MSHQGDMHPINPFKDYESGGIALAGCFMIGLGAGLFYHPLWLGLVGGAVIGLGVGLVVMGWLSRDRYK
ncbi:MAG TPA: hypothetical protein VI322_01680 [Candidatus Saccharimonadia bacterium]